MSDLCKWPACSCKATGQYCSSKPTGKKNKVSISKQSVKAKENKIEKKEVLDIDTAFYLIIWMERPHVCQNCNAQLYEFTILYFHHVLPKRPDGGYPQYRHCKWNIWILCWQCHDTHDNGNPDSKTLLKLKAYYHKLLLLHETGVLENVQPHIQSL